MNDNEDYMNLVKNQIELDKLLHSVTPSNKEKAKELFNKKKEIMKKNGLFADFQLKNINKKIEKLKNNS